MEPRVLALSFTGPVFSPPPYTNKNTHLWNPFVSSNYVMKTLKLSAALHEIRIRHALERRWLLLPLQRRFRVQSLDDVFLLPHDEIRDFEVDPPLQNTNGKPISNGIKANYVGIYAPFGGQTWNSYLASSSAFPPKEKNDATTCRRVLSLVTQLLRAVLLLHELNVVHNDVWVRNVIVDPKTEQVRLIDWESSALHHWDRQPKDDLWLHDQVGFSGYAREPFRVFRKWDMRGPQISAEWGRVVSMIKTTPVLMRWIFVSMNLPLLENNMTDAGAEALLDRLEVYLAKMDS